MAIQITRSDLTSKVEIGWKKKALAEHYGLPVSQMTQVLKDAGLTIRKFHAPKYVLVDEIAEEAQAALQAEDVVQSLVSIETVGTIVHEDESSAVESVTPVTDSPSSGW